MQGTMSEVNRRTAAFVVLVAVFSYYVIQNHFSLPNRYRSLVQDNERMKRILNATADTTNTISAYKVDLVEKRKRLMEEKKMILLDTILLFGMLNEKSVKNMVDDSYPIEIQTLLQSVAECMQKLPGLEDMKTREASSITHELEELSSHSCTDFETLKKNFEMLASWRRGDGTRLKISDSTHNGKEKEVKEGGNKDSNVITKFIKALNHEKDLTIEEQKKEWKRTVEIYRKEVESIEYAKDTKLVDKSEIHPLIVASDEDYATKTVKSWLDPPFYGSIKSQDDSCHNSFGIGLVEKWSKQREVWCEPEGEKSDSGTTRSKTEISCYPFRQDGHSAVDNLCSLRNILFDISDLQNDEVTSSVMQKYVESKHSDEAYIHWKDGTLKGTCKITQNFRPDKLPLWNKDLISSYHQVSSTEDPATKESDKAKATSDSNSEKGSNKKDESKGEKSAKEVATGGEKSPPEGAGGGGEVAKQSASVGGEQAAKQGAAQGRRLNQHRDDASGLQVSTVAVNATGADFPRRALSTVGDEAARANSWKPLQCDEWEETATIVLQRDTFANFFHDSEDFFNLFLALAILDLGLSDFQLFFLDLYPRGPFFDIWTNAFAKSPDRVFRAWDVKNKYKGSKICFSRLITGIVGPASPLTIHTSVTKCARSPLVIAYADWMIRGLKVHHKTTYVYPGERKYLLITWMSRKSSVKWPELNFCEDDTFWKCSLFSHLGIRELRRVVKNEDEVIQKLRTLEETEFKGSKRVIVSRKDYNQMSFREQIAVDAQTDIMIGPHGAGLTHSLFMPDDSFLIELGIDGSSGLKHFENMAIWRRGPQRYFRIANSPNPVQVDTLYDKVILAIDTLTKSQT